MALAYFITFSTYGTWLHGSPKGSADKKHNAFETPWLEPDVERESKARKAMLEPGYTMSAAERQIVCKAIVELAREREWFLWAVHVRTNHAQIVVSADRDPGRLMSEMKARASRDLTRAGFGTPQQRRWTRHGSTLHLYREEQISAKIHYTLDEQGERMACYARE